MDLTPRDVVRLRLANLLLAGHDHDGPAAVARWLGAMQAQDLGSGKWSFGVRLPSFREADVDAAIESAQVLRTWPMRGTIHFIAAEDARWLLRTTGARALAGAARRRAMLGLSQDDVDRATAALADALRGGGRLPRSEAIAEMADAGVATAGQRGYHLIWYASQVGVTCLGPNQGREQTIVLLDEWAPRQRELGDDDAYAELALRYVRSHGPVAVTDFAGWAGIPLGRARAAIAAAGGALVPVTIAGRPLWLGAAAAADAAALIAAAPRTVVLPGFDEFLLGYKDRSAMLAAGDLQRVVPGNNGMFRATVVDDGSVVATWRQQRRAAHTAISVEPLRPLSAAAGRRVTRAFAGYGRYLDREVTVTIG